MTDSGKPKNGLNVDSIGISSDAVLSHEPDPKTLEEQEALESQSALLDIQDKEQNIKARKEYANKIFVMVCVWLTASLLAVFFNGFGAPATGLYYQILC